MASLVCFFIGTIFGLLAVLSLSEVLCDPNTACIRRFQGMEMECKCNSVYYLGVSLDLLLSLCEGFCVVVSSFVISLCQGATR